MLKPAAVLILLAIFAAPAWAGDLHPTDGGAVFSALPGEVNRVVFKRSGRWGVFSDVRNPVATADPCISLASARARCPVGGPDAVGVSLGDGRDRFRVARGSRLPRGSIVEGGRGGDHLRGGPGPERIDGDSGNDSIVAGRGRDRVDCGRGRDRVVAQVRDELSGCETILRP